MNDVTNGAGAVTEATAIGLYLIYAFLAVGLVAFLARTLQRNGQVFLERTLDREELATAINQLLVIGFYLLNMGYALLIYRLQPSYPSLVDAFNELVGRLGLLHRVHREFTQPVELVLEHEEPDVGRGVGRGTSEKPRAGGVHPDAGVTKHRSGPRSERSRGA